MAEEKGNPTWSLVVWGVPALICIGYGVLCVLDGWFREGYEHAEFSRWAAGPVFIAGLWCAWRGIKEYRDVKSAAEEQGPDAGAPVADGQVGSQAPEAHADNPADNDRVS